MEVSVGKTTTRNKILLFILTLGVIGIRTTESGVIGILPLIAGVFNVTVPRAGLTVSVFALGIAISALFLPVLLSGIGRKKIMLLSLGVFTLGNIISMLTSNFPLILAVRLVSAFFHPVYISMAFTLAAASVNREEAPGAVSKIFIGISLGAVLGIPVTTFIASETSFSMAMLFFAVVNAAAFTVTAFLVPPMPVTAKLSYGKQFAVLKKPLLWHSLVTYILLNAAVFGVYSYFSDYLRTVTNISFRTISGILFAFTVTGVLGNVIAGKILVKNAFMSIITAPLLLAVVYILLFIFGSFMYPVILIALAFGILTGICSNNGQYIVSISAPESPDFANGLFISSGNLGILIGTSVGGLFISGMGTRYVVLGSLLFLSASIILVIIRRHIARC
jgi:predicted MFS family arabinose efflux permease